MEMNAKTSKWIGLFALVVLAIAAFVLITGSPFRVYRGITPNQMRAKLRAEVPLGSSVVQVVNYLDANKIEHAPYSPERHDVGAIKRNVCVAVMVECSIDIRFFFDEGARLQRITVEAGFTGL